MNHRHLSPAQRAVLKPHPSDGGSLRQLAHQMIAAGKLTEALPVLDRLVRTHPQDADLLAMFGRCLVGVGQNAAAYEVLGRALKADPRQQTARLWLGRCHSAMGRPAEAVALLEPLAAESPGDAIARNSLGQALWAAGRGPEAVEHLRAANTLRPTAAGRAELGWVLYHLDRTEEALAEFDGALSVDPMCAAAIAGKASVLADTGERNAALELVQDAVGAGVSDVPMLHLYARLASEPQQRAAAKGAIGVVLGRTSNAAARSTLLLAMAQLQDAEGDYDGAFASAKAGNDLIQFRFDPAAAQRGTNQLVQVFSRENCARLPRAAHDEMPIFIVGMPRSGTSLVEQILASHPSVYGAGELPDLSRTARSLQDLMRPRSAQPYPECALSLSQEDVDRVASDYLGDLRRKAGGAPRVTDKTPRNFLFLGLVDVLFPGARVIHCVRHPLDTCLSCYMTALDLGHAYRTRFPALASVYREYLRLMKHWRATLRIPILDVRYEDLVAEPELGSRRMVEFVGLPWDDACMQFHRNRRVVRTASADQVKRPVYDTSVGRWKRYERHLRPLIEALGDLTQAGGPSEA